MSEENDPERQPVVQPRLIRFARRRPKLVNLEFRDEFLKNLEENVCERRCPPNISDSAGRTVAMSAERAVEPVLQSTFRQRLSDANAGPLKWL